MIIHLQIAQNDWYNDVQSTCVQFTSTFYDTSAPSHLSRLFWHDMSIVPPSRFVLMRRKRREVCEIRYFVEEHVATRLRVGSGHYTEDAPTPPNLW